MLVAALSIWSAFLFVVVVLQRRSIVLLSDEVEALSRVPVHYTREGIERMRDEYDKQMGQYPGGYQAVNRNDRGSCSGGGGT